MVNDELKSDPVLVWGIAGASLGMEIARSLAAGGYRRILGCDISSVAFGHFSDVFTSTFVLDRQEVRTSLSSILREAQPRFVIAGGDEVTRLTAKYADLFAEFGCRICGNSPDVVTLATDKFEVMQRLQDAGFRVPVTRLPEDALNGDVPLPAVFKPRFDSGGSRGVFVVSNAEELQAGVTTALKSGVDYIVQEYLPEDDGEYTIGILSKPDGSVAGSVLMRRTFQNMLSVHERTEEFLISSGSSQGIFEHNQSLQSQAEGMAEALGSTGPLNVQARAYDGRLVPFEINPRFSASTYLRTLSGVNEVDLSLQYLVSPDGVSYPEWNEGLAIRTFGEVFVDKSELPDHVL